MNAHRHALACFWALEEGEKEPTPPERG